MNKNEVDGSIRQKEPRMRWMDNIRHGMNKMEVRGSRAEGRPRMRWMDNIRRGMNKNEVDEGDGRHQA